MLALAMSGCTNWLDKEPTDRILEGKAYSSEGGIDNILNGLYRTITSNGLYGSNLTAGTVDVLAHYYAYPQNDPAGTALSDLGNLYRLATYDYYNETVRKDYIDPIWTNGYRFIMQLNQFINQLENLEEGILKDERRRLYLGEAYGMRAMIHMDLYRFFGPISATGDSEILPYHGNSNVELAQYLAPVAFLTKVKDDLEKAETLMINTDPIVLDEKVWDGENDDLDMLPEDRFAKMYRNKRMNYWAVQVLKARTHMLLGEYDDVISITDDILTNAVDATYHTQMFQSMPMRQKNKPFGWTPNSNTWLENSILYDEVIFGPSKIDMDAWWDDMYLRIQIDNDEHPYLVIRDNLFVNMSTDEAITSDRRFLQWRKSSLPEGKLTIDASQPYYYSTKFSYLIISDSHLNNKGWLGYNIRNMRALIRLSEVQYMKAEALLKEYNDIQGAIDAINIVLRQRGFTETGSFDTNSMIPANATEDQVWQMLELEYYREFVMEGQAWFFLKRNNDDTVINGYDQGENLSSEWKEANYRPFIPKSEEDFYDLKDEEEEE